MIFTAKRTLLVAALYCVPLVCSPAIAQVASPLELGPNGRLVYRPYTPQGDKILDFSNAGYGGGGVALPQVAVKMTLSPSASPQDDSPRIQKAIDELSKMPVGTDGFRGALLLKRGVYRLGSTLNITSSGIVLRGEESIGKGTVLLGITRKPYTLISVLGGAIQPLPQTSQTVTDEYVPVGSRTLNVADASKFAVGDKVLVTRFGNAAWIHEIKMDQIKLRNPKKPEMTRQWRPFSLIFDRVITQVKGNTLTFDAPLANSIDQKWGGGSVAKYNDSARISNVGIENMFGDSEFDAAIVKDYEGKQVRVDENHANLFVNFEHSQNIWARDLNARHVSDAVIIGKGTKHGTIQDCSLVEPISQITGGRRAPFSSRGQLTLWQRLRADESRHAFVFDSRVTGPNVFLDCFATNEHGASEAHHRWAVGGLYDNVKGNLTIMNRHNMGSGQGWAGANFVVWNGEGDLKLQTPPTAENFAIGYVGQKSKPSLGETSGVWVSYGQHVEPRSLYLQQLEERLGAQAVKNITRKSGG